jgi:PAS domain-containing protein
LRKANGTLEERVVQRSAQREALNRTLIQDSERFAIAADAAGLGFWTFNVPANTLQWDERMFRLYGLPPSGGELPYSLWTSHLHPETGSRR